MRPWEIQCRTGNATSAYRGAQGIDPELVKQLNAMYGFDKPPLKRFLTMLGNYARFDLGTSYFRDVLHCQDALYLDGAVSSLYSPGLDRNDRWTDLGPLIGAVE